MLFKGGQENSFLKTRRGKTKRCSECRSFIFYALFFRLNGNAFPVCADFAADAEPLAVGDAKLNL